jgi:hypothetical protein
VGLGDGMAALGAVEVVVGAVQGFLGGLGFGLSLKAGQIGGVYVSG